MADDKMPSKTILGWIGGVAAVATVVGFIVNRTDAVQTTLGGQITSSQTTLSNRIDAQGARLDARIQETMSQVIEQARQTSEIAANAKEAVLVAESAVETATAASEAAERASKAAETASETAAAAARTAKAAADDLQSVSTDYNQMQRDVQELKDNLGEISSKIDKIIEARYVPGEQQEGTLMVDEEDNSPDHYLPENEEHFTFANIIGAPVYAGGEEPIGEITEVLPDRNGAPERFVIKSGGFLGIGEKQIAVEASDLNVANGKISIEMSVQEISEMPEQELETSQ